MKCSECGGNVISTVDLVYRDNGDVSGEHRCTNCGRKIEYYRHGTLEEPVMDMSEGVPNR